MDDIRREADRQWAERGWPADLLARARRFHIPDDIVLRMLYWNAPLERVQEEVAWAEKLQQGNMRFRQLTWADNEAFCELWAHAPEQIGEWDVTVLRGPNGFASFELQERPVLNGLFDGAEMVACVSFSLRHTIVGGERISVRYGQAMRVHEDHRGKAYAHWVRSLPWAIGLNMPTRIQYDYIRARNMTMERWNAKFMPHVSSVPKRDDDVPGVPVTVLQFPASGSGDPLPRGVRPAREADYARCAELINRTHAGRDLFRPYTPEWLTERLNPDVPPGPWVPPYHAADFYVFERRGAITACAGLWDRGRDTRERWRHRESGQERTVSGTALLDMGFAEGGEDDMAQLIVHFIGLTAELGRDFLTAPLETQPELAALLTDRAPEEETRYLQWRAETPALRTPAHLDLVYW